jgi:hypothetical protein
VVSGTAADPPALPRELTLSVPDVVTAWPHPRIRTNRQAHRARDGKGVTITVTIDRDLHEILRAHVARLGLGRTDSIQAAVRAALRTWLRLGGFDGR